MINFSKDSKEIFNDALQDIILCYIEERIPFKLVIVNIDNWDNPLPKEIMLHKQLVLDITEEALEDSYFDEETQQIVLSTGFNNTQYIKYLDMKEVLGLLSMDSMGIMIKPFVEDLKTKKKLVPDSGILHSYELFKRNNPGLSNIDILMNSYKEK